MAQRGRGAVNVDGLLLNLRGRAANKILRVTRKSLVSKRLKLGVRKVSTHKTKVVERSRPHTAEDDDGKKALEKDAQQHFIYSDLVKKCLKTKKDENAPKKPRSSYIMYCNSIRKEVTETHPTLKMHEISKKLSERWNGITDEVKKKFQEDAEKDRERYKTEHDVYKDKLCEQNGSLTGIGSSNSSC